MLFAMTLSVFVSCDKDELEPIEEVSNKEESICFEDSTPTDLNHTCSLAFDSIEYCDREFIGVFGLEQNTKEYMPQYCMDDESLIYTRMDGQSKDFVVYHKYHIIGSSISLFYDYCLDGRKFSVCKISEHGAVILESEDLNIGFTIRAKTDIDSAEPTSGKVGDFIIVSVRTILSI